MANHDVTIIRVRRVIPGKSKYCACDSKGNPIRGQTEMNSERANRSAKVHEKSEYSER